MGGPRTARSATIRCSSSTRQHCWASAPSFSSSPASTLPTCSSRRPASMHAPGTMAVVCAHPMLPRSDALTRFGHVRFGAGRTLITGAAVWVPMVVFKNMREISIMRCACLTQRSEEQGGGREGARRGREEQGGGARYRAGGARALGGLLGPGTGTRVIKRTPLSHRSLPSLPPSLPPSLSCCASLLTSRPSTVAPLSA